jgi:fructose-1,6-bisphosphatase/inositol monophosphatase family enzyme
MSADDAFGNRRDRRASASAETPNPPEHQVLLAAEHAVDTGARIFRQGRAHIGALIAKGDRDFATSVDLQIESAIRTSLADATPAIRS